jgi:hypothetical protein
VGNECIYRLEFNCNDSNKYRYRWNWNWALIKSMMKGMYRIVPGRFFVKDHSNRIVSA